jgi:bifunctional UDP-N-acetylglucosamine pyrophosphorylase/glucosamine-1-phosphate N-acetyltransferase
MAAGSSTRTHPLTVTRPKPLVPIWDRPLLEHQLRQLAGIVDEAVVVVGFLREQIERRFGDAFEGIALRYAVQHQQRGTADALLAARPFLRSRALVLNGDDFYHRDDLKGLSETGRGLLVARARDPQNRGVVTIEAGRVTGIVEKPAQPPPDAWCSTGGYCIEEEDLAQLDGLPPSPRGELELPDLVLRLIHSKTVRPFRIERFWLPITYSWDVLNAALFLWDDPERARVLSLGVSTSTAWEGPVWLGENVRIGENVRLVGPSAVGAGAELEDGVTIERSILFENVRVERGARVSDSVLGASVTIGAGARLASREGSTLEIEVKGKRVVPEIPRLGAVLGDGARVPASATVAPGKLIAPGESA